MARRRGARSAALVVIAVGALASACGTPSGDALAQRACAHVDRSLHLYREAQQTRDPRQALAWRNQALDELRAALPLAAQATSSSNGQWVALETTISESARVDEGELLVALRQECAAVDNQQGETAPGAPPAP
ncbi:MAG TPA: hypothetical protein VKV36_13040 [Acidimicrobiales bacterium]|nr:hypothetical protein [Acidimicrobiales bacterium]